MTYSPWDPRRIMPALKHSGFRWFVLGRIAGAPTGPMRAVVMGWLIYELTGSALALGWVTSARAVIMLICSPFGGVFSDRFEKRWVMLAARIYLITVSLVVVLLLALGALRLWHLAVVAMLEGVAFSVMAPALHSIVAELVERETLLNAMSVNAVFEGGMAILGPLGAGLLIEWVGPIGVYLSMCVLFGFAGYTLFRLPEGLSNDGDSTTVHSEVLKGARYLWLSPVLIVVLGLSFARGLFGQPYRVFLPAFAQDQLGFGAAGLGALTSAMGVGALLSSMLAASLGNTHHKGRLLLGSGIAAGMCLILLVWILPIPAPFLFVALVAGFISLARLVTRTLLQSHSKPGYRGRIASIGMMLHSLSTLGALPAGALADVYGVPTVISALAVLLMLVHGGVGLLRPEVRRLR